jgi:hypothetical protein
MVKTPDIATKATLDPKDFEKGARAASKATRDLQKQIAADARASEQSFKQVTMAIAKIGAALIVAKQAFDIYAKVMQSTHGTADAFEITMSRIKFSVAELVRSIATGSFKDLADRMKEAAENGQELAEQLDYVFELSLRLKLVTADTELAMAKQQLIYRDKRNPWQMRVDAATEYLRLVKVLETEQLAFAQEEKKGAMLQPGVAASRLSEERLKYYEMNATLLKDNEVAVKGYIKALSDLKIAEDQQAKQPVSAATAGIAGTTVYQSTIYAGESVDELKAKIAGASDVVKGFATDYTQWLLAIDPERALVMDSFAKLKNVERDAELAKMKPLRTVNQLLKEEQTELKETIRDMQDYVTVWNSMVFPERTKQPALPGTSGVTALIPKDYTNELIAAENELMKMNELATTLGNTFANLFSAGMEGWEELGQTIMNVMKQLMAKVVALIAAYLIFNVLSGGTISLAGVGAYLMKGFNMPKLGAADEGIGLKGKFLIDGKGMAMAVTRSGNVIYNNT